MTQESEGEGKFKKITLRVTEEEHRRIKVFAAERGQTIKDLFFHCFNRMIEESQKDQEKEKSQE